MTPNNRLYSAAWLWHWYLNDALDESPGAIRKSVRRLFPYKTGDMFHPLGQSYARSIHIALRKNPPKVTYV